MRLSASTNPPKEEELLEYCKELESLHVDMIHCDCMDGHFVPATCLELPKLLEVSRATSTPLDCHVMINSPIKLMKKIRGGWGYDLHIPLRGRVWQYTRFCY